MTRQTAARSTPTPRRSRSATLVDLKRRLRALTAPSYELDCLVFQFLEPDRVVVFEQGTMETALEEGKPAVRGLLRDYPMEGWSDWKSLALHLGAPHYTGSLEAARATILPGLFYESGAGQRSPREPMYGCIIRRPTGFKERYDELGLGESNCNEAIAVIMASLDSKSGMAP